MGVPSFYRWLVGKYPNVVVNAVEERGENIDTSQSNPNRLEFDNLYLDMNGIIHPCFHPDDHLSPPTTFEEVFKSIYSYIDRLFCIVRPRKLLFMAIDGVAPRAKMNQQRCRRFRTAKDSEIAEAEEDRLRKEYELEGKEVLPKLESEVWDSNVITPGTEFMYKLSNALEYYIRLRLSKDPGWKEIKVILSDANTPGEGEHKIMSFIRLQRNLPGYIPNTRHCLYGLDADLIMLALATHEIHFSILREDVVVQEQRPSCASALETSLAKAESGLVKSRGWFGNVNTINGGASMVKKPYQFLNVWTLREYLELDIKISNPSFEINFERIVDDFIFICFFTGNDFLPHMPTLEIHEGAIDLLLTVYKEEFKKLGGYLVDVNKAESQYLNLKRVEKFIILVGVYEEKIFKKRSELRQRMIQRIARENSDLQEDADKDGKLEISTSNRHCGFPNEKVSAFKTSETMLEKTLPSSSGIDGSTVNSEVIKNTMELKQKLKDFIREKSDIFKQGGLERDKVKLGTEGWKQRYYKEKFSEDSPEGIESMRKEIVKRYTEGLCWVLQYYFSGVPSWTWFYPYHYGPFASDLKGLSQGPIKFQMGSPFKPFDQLMGVLPPRSVHALPKAYRALMTCKESGIRDFYPNDFEVDTDGKRYIWQGISNLDFIVEERLLSETKKLEKELKEDEVKRNTVNIDKLFVRNSHELGSKIRSLFDKQISGKEHIISREPIDPQESGGMNGFMRACDVDSGTPNSICTVKEVEDIQEGDVKCVLYELPDGHPHIPFLCEEVELPEKTITEADIVETQLWHEYLGSRPTNRLQNCKAYNEGKYTSNSSSEKETHNGAGLGWGAGRGKGCPDTSNSYSNFDSRRNPVGRASSFSARGELEGAASRWGVGRRNGYSEPESYIQVKGLNRGKVSSTGPASANGEWKVVGVGRGDRRGNSSANGEWKVVGVGRGDRRGNSSANGEWKVVGDRGRNSYVETAKSSQDFDSYAAVQSGNQGFRAYRNGYTDNKSYTFCHNSQSAAAYIGRGRGRGRSNPGTSVQDVTRAETNSSGKQVATGSYYS